MANQLRFRSGQVFLQKLRVDSATVVEAGDLVFLDTDDVKPAADFPWSSDLAATQSAFAGTFVGVSHQQSAEGETADLSIDLSPHAVYEFDVHSTMYEVGDLLGPDELSAALMSQQLEKVGATGQAIARAVEFKANASALLRVSFASAFHTGSANVNAQIG